MKILNTYEFKLPEFLLPALINDDRTGLSDEDEKTFKKAEDTFKELTEENKGNYYTIDYGNNDEDAYFTWRPDFLNVGCNVVDIKVHIFGT